MHVSKSLLDPENLAAGCLKTSLSQKQESPQSQWAVHTKIWPKTCAPSHIRVFRAALLRRGEGWKGNAGRLQARRARKANQTHAAEPDQFGFSFVYYCVLPLPLPLPLPGSANDPSSSHGLRAARRAALACLRVVCSAAASG